MEKSSVKQEIMKILRGVNDKRKLKLILVYIKTLCK